MAEYVRGVIMKQRVKPIVMVVLLAVVSAAMTMLLGQLMAEAEESATCDVPSGSFLTIQSAVNDVSCDTISLTAKLYVENVTITRTVTVHGQGADGTTVDGNASGSVFAIQSGLTVTITDMTITNGKALIGGGIHNDSSTLVLDAVTVDSNTSTGTGVVTNDGGGGVFSSNGEVSISNRIKTNNASGLFLIPASSTRRDVVRAAG